MADEVVAAYATKLFIRSEAEIRRPVVLLTGERTNVYGVLEKHFRETALPPSERFWRTVRTQWTPQLDTWRPRVNGVQLKVLAGARLPESEAEWGALRAALEGVRQHLRADTSVDRLHAELQDFVQMVVGWWENRKKTEGGGGGGAGGGGVIGGIGVGGFSMNGLSGSGLLKRGASSALMMGGGIGPYLKKPCLDYMQLPMPVPLAVGAGTAAPAAGGSHTHAHAQSQPQPSYQQVYVAPEIVSHPLLPRGGSGGAPGRLPDRAPLPPGGDEVIQPVGPQHHGGNGYLSQLANSDAQLFGELFPGSGGGCDGGGSGASGGNMSPHGPLHGGQGGSGQHEGIVAQPDALLGLEEGYQTAAQSPHRHREASSAENKEDVRLQAQMAAPDTKRFVTLNVGGHRFLTTAATLAAVEGAYFSKLAQQAAAGKGVGSSGTAEFFVDRSGKLFEYVLDYLRSQRFGDTTSNLPRDERTLQLLAREAEFYKLTDLADRARAALASLAAAAARAAAVAGAQAEDTPSDMPANIAAEGSAHGGQLLAGRFAAAGGGSAAAALAAHPQGPFPGQPHHHSHQHLFQQQQACTLDAVFLETGFKHASELAEAQAALLQQLNKTIQARQGEGYSVVEYKCGTEREGQQRSLHYHVLLRKAVAA